MKTRVWASLFNALQVPLSVLGAFYIAGHEYLIGIVLIALAVFTKFTYTYAKPYWDD